MRQSMMCLFIKVLVMPVRCSMWSSVTQYCQPRMVPTRRIAWLWFRLIYPHISRIDYLLRLRWKRSLSSGHPAAVWRPSWPLRVWSAPDRNTAWRRHVLRLRRFNSENSAHFHFIRTSWRLGLPGWFFLHGTKWQRHESRVLDRPRTGASAAQSVAPQHVKGLLPGKQRQAHQSALVTRWEPAGQLFG